MKPVFGGFVCAAGDGKVGDCALITPVYLEIALISGAKDGAIKARCKLHRAKNGQTKTTVRVHRGLTVIQLPAGAFRVLSEHHNNLAQPTDVAERHPHHRYLGRIVRRIYGR